MIMEKAVEAALIEWYGPDWVDRYYPGKAYRRVGEAREAMQRAIEAANRILWKERALQPPINQKTHQPSATDGQ